MIDFEHVSKTYETHNDENVALEDINIHIDEGEFVFILGHSGAGKSTFLKLIQMEEKPTEGRVLINGQDLTKIKRRKVPYLRRQMGVVFQDFRLIPTMTVLCLYGKLMARSGDIIDMSLDEESPPQSRPLKIALCKRLLSDVNALMGHFMKIRRDFPPHAAKCQEHEAVLGQLHDNLLDVMGELRKG